MVAGSRGAILPVLDSTNACSHSVDQAARPGSTTRTEWLTPRILPCPLCLAGGDLMTLLIKEDILPEQAVRFYAAEAVMAVQSVHALGETSLLTLRCCSRLLVNSMLLHHPLAITITRPALSRLALVHRRHCYNAFFRVHPPRSEARQLPPRRPGPHQTDGPGTVSTSYVLVVVGQLGDANVASVSQEHRMADASIPYWIQGVLAPADRRI